MLNKYIKEDLKSDLRWLKKFIPFVLVAIIATLIAKVLVILTVYGIARLFDLHGDNMLLVDLLEVI